jgi:hypothetical protein
MRGNVLALPKRSDALHGLLDPIAGVSLARVEDAEEVSGPNGRRLILA